jgi:hypothetical protein
MKRLGYAGLGLTVLITGGYLIVYTARWEWQRALMAGELLLVSLLLLLAVAAADRFSRLERRLAELTARTRPAGEPPPGRSYGTPGVPAPEFRWLQPDRYGVFIPVLLGAGIAVSGLAVLVERIAGRLSGRGAVRGPAPLTPPSGGVLAGGEFPPGRVGGGPGGRLRVLIGTLIVASAAALAVAELADHTQDRPDPPAQAATSTVIIEGRANDATPIDAMAVRLWEYCRGSTRPYLRESALTPIGGARFAVVVHPALGRHALRRLRGCLEDAVVDHGQFRVVAVQPPAR